MHAHDARRLGWLLVAAGLLAVVAFGWVALYFAYAGEPRGDNLMGALLVCAVIALGGLLSGVRYLGKGAPRPT